ncbi:MAG: hypothetical protein WD824_00585 [Cyclobacteriaceae bacterium]
MKTSLTACATLLAFAVFSQNAVKKSVVIGSMANKPNAILIVNPQHADQGVLLPQLSTDQRLALKPSSPSENGLIVFDTNARAYFYWSEGAWVRLFADNHRKDSYLSIDPIHFQELKANNNVGQSNLAVFETDNTFVTASRSGLGEEIIAPVNLPHGSALKEITVYYMDNDSDNLKVHLIRKSLSGVNEQIISWESSGTVPFVRTESFNNFNSMGSVDLENYTYRVVVVFDIDDDDTIDEPSQAKQRMYGVRIKYQQ